MSTVTEREWTIEMLWQCKHCRTINPGVTGAERESLKCSLCGGEKTDEEWLMPDSPETAPELSGDADAKARAGENWACLFCGAESRAVRSSCEVCGAKRGSDAPDRSDRNEAVDPTPREPIAPTERSVIERPFKPTASGIGGIVKVLGAFASLALVAWFFVRLFSPNETVARVTSMVWSRERRLEERHDYSREGWKRDAPPLVFSWDSCETRQSGTVQCHPHDCYCHTQPYDCHCTGGDRYSCRCVTTYSNRCSSSRNGTARCRRQRSETCGECRTQRRCSTCYRNVCTTCYDRCPVYAEWCRYRYHQWDEIARRRLDGRGVTCQWPDVTATGELQRVLGEEHYEVRFGDTRSSRTWQRTYAFDEYERFREGQMRNVEWTRAGGLVVKGVSQ